MFVCLEFYFNFCILFDKKFKGKTTIINNFLDRSETLKPTLALEYSFGRRNAGPQGIQKQICNVWELGSLSNSTSLMNVPIKSQGFDNFSAIVVLNLLYPDRLWGDLEAALNGLKETISSHSNAEAFSKWHKASEKRVGLNHPDLKTLDLFPFPVVIIGGYYDKFQDFGKIQNTKCFQVDQSVNNLLLTFLKICRSSY